ncbi:hypothetical protein LJR175_007631 [Variovorax sp. LjRoot175]|uniref:hypothetical protein n=1 Tax=Variovorax sp. LjRoot175 TaxID=3342276 RepID=UPI003ED0EF22
MNEFLNPKSMATPGAAGAMVMFVANSICFQFPEVEFRWTTIALSFFAGAIVFSAKELVLSHRAAFWILNSLIIFSVGVGTSNIAAKIQQLPAVAHHKADNMLFDLLVPSAHAQDASNHPGAGLPDTAAPRRPATTMSDLQSENKQLRAENAQLQTEATQLQRLQRDRRAIDARADFAKKSRDGFFRSW